jgi:gliotoxin/aspirochlorine biosynthesis gamma-glutamylcyclotransferase
MPPDYQDYLQSIPVYEPSTSRRGRAGAAVFLGFWGPVMELMEKITRATLQEDGNAPAFVVWLVRFTVYLMWFIHDVFFAPLCGRGDGCSEDDKDLVQKWERDGQSPLLEKRESDRVEGLV